MHYYVNVCNSSVSCIQESVTEPVTAKCVTFPPKTVYHAVQCKTRQSACFN